MKKSFIITSIFILFALICNLQSQYPVHKVLVNGTNIDLNKTNSSVEADTNVTNQILQVWYSSTELFVKVKVVDKNKNISLTVYNMLGKELIQIFEGVHTRDENPYIVRYSLPNGIYICVLQGESFRDAEKFIISR